MLRGGGAGPLGLFLDPGEEEGLLVLPAGNGPIAPDSHTRLLKIQVHGAHSCAVQMADSLPSAPLRPAVWGVKTEPSRSSKQLLRSGTVPRNLLCLLHSGGQRGCYGASPPVSASY